MITIQSGKMIIPENERFVGFAGDNLTRTKQFLVPDAADSDSAYILYLRFDDDRVASAVLEKGTSGADLVLTWHVRAEHMLKSGVILAQIRITDGDTAVAHTGCDYFVAAASTELDDDGAELDILRRTEFERRMAEAVAEARATAPYIGDDGYWYVYSPEAGDYVRSWSAGGGGAVDSEISATSTNPVQNKVVKAYIDAAAAGIPTALSQLTNDSGYIPRLIGSAAPPSTGTTDAYPVPCIWEYYDGIADTLTFWLVYHRSEITVPGSPSQYYYDSVELAQAEDIPTKTSDLTNDSGFLTAHQDISGKADKATTLAGYGITNAYTKTEVDGLIPSVPTKTSQLTNDSGFLTAHQDISGKMEKAYTADTSAAVAAVPTGQLFIGQGRLTLKKANGYDVIAYSSDIPTVPTKTSDLTNDSGFLTLATLPVYSGGVQ